MKKTDETIQLLNVVVELADEFSEALSLTPPSERAEVEEIPVAATIALSRALTYEDDGEVEQAIEQYEAVLVMLVIFLLVGLSLPSTVEGVPLARLAWPVWMFRFTRGKYI